MAAPASASASQGRPSANGYAGRLLALLPSWLRRPKPTDPEPALRALLGSLEGGLLCVVDAAGSIVYLGTNVDEVLGDGAAAASPASLPELLRPEDAAALRNALQRAFADGANPFRETIQRRAGGPSRWLELRGVRLAPPSQDQLLLEIRNVTVVRAEQERLRAVVAALDGSPDSVLVTDRLGTIVHVNSGFERMTGFTREEAIGRSTNLLKSGKHRPEFYRRLWTTLLEGKPFRAEFVDQRKDGDSFQVEQVIAPLLGADGAIKNFIAIARDIGERKRIESEFEERAYFDPLTGLPGQRLFRERAKHSLALARRHGATAALLYADLQGFRAVNSRYGRAVGDEVLRKMADRLRQTTRESDALARVTADEFLILLSEVRDEDSIGGVARRVRESLARPLEIGDAKISLSARFGIAVYPQDAGNYQELLTRADAALERARTGGGDFEFYRPELSVHTREQLHLEDDLKDASEHEQFVLHYQPIVAAETGRVVGAEALTRGQMAGMEALARWPHLERGILSPAEFIPLAERTGRIVSLDRWAISAAVRQAAYWVDRGWGGWMSVNLSPRSLEDPDLPRYITRTLEARHLDPQRLVLEITESAAVRDAETTTRVLNNLKSVGVKVAIDDFGVGHTSLAYLKNFPVDLLKLDQTFIKDIGDDPKDERLIEVMITLAHRIGAQVIAEGVEDENQLLWLRAVGCDMVQGYLVGHPVPPEDVRPQEKIPSV